MSSSRSLVDPDIEKLSTYYVINNVNEFITKYCVEINKRGCDLFVDNNIIHKVVKDTQLTLKNKEDLIKCLVKYCNINNKDKNNKGNTALIDTVEGFQQIQNSQKIVELLLNNGADINDKNDSGNTALISAVINNNYEMAKFLLDRGANPDRRDDTNTTPLIFAVKKHNYEIVKLLRDKGADLSIKDDTGSTALNHAYRIKNEKIRTEIVNLLLFETKT